jgi:hypothetical protein
MKKMFYAVVAICAMSFAACNGNMRFEKKTKQVEISNVKEK